MAKLRSPPIWDPEATVACPGAIRRSSPTRPCRWTRAWPAAIRARQLELNPVEGLWSCLKAVELATLASPTLAVVIDQAHRGIQRVRRTPHLAYSFLRQTGLSVA